MPLMYPRASATLARLGRAALPDEVQAAARSAAGAGRSGAERAAQDADSAGGRRVVRRGRAGDRRADDAADRRRCRRSIRRSKGAARSTLERMQHDLQTLHGKMIQAAKRRDETLRRQFIARAGARLPRRPRAGTDDRVRLVPEPVRPGARRTAGRGAAARPRAALDRHDLSRSGSQALGELTTAEVAGPMARPMRPKRARERVTRHDPAVAGRWLAEALGAARRRSALAIPAVLAVLRRRLLLRPLRAADRRAAARRARARAAARASPGRSSCAAASR